MKKGILIIAIALLVIPLIRANFNHSPTITKEITLKAFERIALQDAFHATIKYGTTQKVVISGPSKIVNNAEFKVRRDMLVMEMKEQYRNNQRLKVSITIPKLKEVQVNGSGSVYLHAFPNFADLTLEANGSGDIQAKEDLAIANNLIATLTGSGSVMLGGKAQRSEIAVHGSGKFKGADLKTNSSEASLSGSGNAMLYASEHIEAYLSGSGSLYYKGKPKIESQTTGSGQIEPID